MQERGRLGTISHLWRFPIKALRAEALERATLDEHGLAGDRRAALFVTSPEHARTGKTLRGKEHNLLHTVSELAAAAALAAARDVRVVTRGAGPYFDDQPVSLIVDSWLAEAEALVGMPLDPLRYRPNLFVRADPTFHGSEAALVGATLAAGEVLLRVTKTIGRCVTTTYDVETGSPEPAVLRAVAEHRGNVMGVYCTVLVPGTLVLGTKIDFAP